MTEKTGRLPPETTFDEVKVRIQQTFRNPNVGFVKQVVLKDGPRTYRLASLFEIKNPNTNEFHHYCLKIDSLDFRKKDGWFAKVDKSVSIDGDGDEGGELEKLYKFLCAVYEDKLPNQSGHVHIIDAKDYARLEKILDALPNLAAADKLELIKTVLNKLDESPDYTSDFVKIFQESNHAILANISAASRLVEYRAAYSDFERLIDNQETKEPEIQKHLESNPWIFGGEYSELLDRRIWTRDQAFDFMLRRSIDNFLEIIEIKRAIKDPLFNFDSSHKCYYPSAKLSQVIGQVLGYMENVERSRDSIIAKDGEDPARIRARIVIGRDGSKEEQAALHLLNCHLHRVEVMTYDQLRRISQRTLSFFECRAAVPNGKPKNEDEFPF
jgi:hypothetical protein